MNSILPDILLKLDAPEDGQTYLGDSFNFRFWIADPSTDRPLKKEDFEYDILCQEVKPAPSSSYVGTVSDIVLCSSGSQELGFTALIVEEVEFQEGGLYQSPDGKINSPILEVSGRIKRDVSLFGTFVFKIRVKMKGVSITSNVALFNLSSKKEFEGKNLGGPIRKIPELHFGQAIILRGWALSLGDEIESVEAIVPSASKVFVDYGLEIKDLEKSLPDLEEAKTSGIEVVALFDSCLENTLVTFNIRVKFKSGEFFDYYWGSTYVNTEIKSGFVISKIEEEGRWVRVEGDLFSPVSSLAKFFMCSSRSIRELSADYVKISDGEHCLERVDSTYFCSSGSSKVSFLLPNDFLGGNPGSVALEVRIDGKPIRVIGSHVKEKFSLIFNPTLLHGKGRVLSRLFKWFGSRGILPVKEAPSNSPVEDRKGSREVLFISHNLSLTEGAPKVLYSIIQGISKQYRGSIVSLRDGEARGLLADKVKNIYVIPEADQLGLNIDRFKIGAASMGGLLDKENPVLVLANGLDSYPLVCSCIERGKDVFWIIHESINPAHWYAHLPISIRHRFIFALRNVNLLVFVSDSTRELYLPFIKDRASSVIRNGIDVEAFHRKVQAVDIEREKLRLKMRPEVFVLLTVGTTAERKGQDRTIRELAIFKKNHPDLNFRMYFVGAREIPFLWSMRQLVEKLGLEKEVVFVPETDEVAKYYAIADCFIINSREESSPLVALEAFSAGVPLVSTTVFGLADLIINGENSLAFDGDKEGELAEILIKVARDGALSEKLSREGSKFVREEYTLDRMLGEYERLVGDVANDTP